LSLASRHPLRTFVSAEVRITPRICTRFIVGFCGLDNIYEYAVEELEQRKRIAESRKSDRRDESPPLSPPSLPHG
jgi:hypothetical protein